MNRYKVFIALLALCFATIGWSQSLSSNVDRTSIDSHEILQLTVRYQGQVFSGQPDFSGLTKSFDVLSNNRQQQLSWVNGKSKSYTDWHLTLMPKNTGTLLIPSFNFKGHISNALEITVHKASNSSSGNQPVFTETLLDKTEGHIQEQFLLTQRFYSSLRLSDLSLTELALPNTIIHKVGEHQYQKQISGTSYTVTEVKYALFPQTSGQLKIPTLHFAGYESSTRDRFSNFFSRGNRVLRATEQKTLNVAAKPAQIPASEWMPASGVSIAQTWSSDTQKLTVGEPVTRTITVTALGLTGAQILPLTFKEQSDYKSYPDKPYIEERADSSGLLGIRRESIALVPNHAGEITLPEISVRWWDTHNKKMQTTTLAAQTLQVAAAAITPAEAAFVEPPLASLQQNDNAMLNTLPPTQPEQSLFLQWSLAINAVLLTLIVGLLLRKPARKPQPTVESESNEAMLSLKQHFKIIEMEAKKQNYRGMRDAILRWGRELLPEASPNTLKQIARQLNDHALEEQFEQLDRQLFTATAEKESSIDISQLLQSLKQHTGKPRQQRKNRANNLEPLYPVSS